MPFPRCLVAADRLRSRKYLSSPVGAPCRERQSPHSAARLLRSSLSPYRDRPVLESPPTLYRAPPLRLPSADRSLLAPPDNRLSVPETYIPLPATPPLYPAATTYPVAAVSPPSAAPPAPQKAEPEATQRYRDTCSQRILSDYLPLCVIHALTLLNIQHPIYQHLASFAKR